jgi:predicted RNA-binding Zn-ribbon protein involved in translation (DUF1610 family)
MKCKDCRIDMVTDDRVEYQCPNCGKGARRVMNISKKTHGTQSFSCPSCPEIAGTVPIGLNLQRCGQCGSDLDVVRNYGDLSLSVLAH